jgi:hypothetical protein
MRLRPYVNHYQNDWDDWLAIIDHVAGALNSLATGLSPFLIANGFKPRISFNWQPLLPSLSSTEQANRRDACAHVKKFEEIWEFARACITKA